MLSEIVVEFVDGVSGTTYAEETSIVLAPAESFAFLAFVSKHWRWTVSPSGASN